ncbi:MAG: hypothetical protein M1827_005734 [Pycnora praestabilis]|nr:MAG: hypothetical protein M1827_005734 [Pycnora praestabilis]
MRPHASLEKDSEANAAAWEAARGAVSGAARWGLYVGILGAAGFAFSPVYRGLTVQFKVFLQMSGMTVGSMIEADRRLRDYEVIVRRNKRLARDQAVWDRYEMLVVEDEGRGSVEGRERLGESGGGVEGKDDKNGER